MKRLLAMSAVLATGLTGVITATEAHAASGTPYTECPAVGQDTSCGILLEINADRTISILGDSSQGPYDGADDTLVGIVNNSSKPVTAIVVSDQNDQLAGFDQDGLCTYITCTWPAPTTYEGPGTSFVTDPNDLNHVEVDFSGGGLQPGKSTYFSLEGALDAASIKAQPGTITPKTNTLTYLNNTMPASSFACQDVVFVGLAGSGENTKSSSSQKGFGAEVYGALHDYVGALPKHGYRIGAYAVPYKADSVKDLNPWTNLWTLGRNLTRYNASIDDGVTKLSSFIATRASKCPDEQYVLAGYSQGAMALHRGVFQIASRAASPISRIEGVLEIADGDRRSNEGAISLGTASASNDGISWTIGHGWNGGMYKPVKRALPNALQDKSYDVCMYGDIVCDTPDVVWDAYFGYHEITAPDGSNIHGNAYKTNGSTRYAGEGLPYVKEAASDIAGQTVIP